MALSRICIEQSAAQDPQVNSICSRLNLPVQIVQDPRQVYELVLDSDDPVKKGKEILFLTHNQGSFIKKCPGTKCYTCCGYMILHIGTYCNMDCSYCILQSYFHPPVLQYFINQNNMLAELDSVFAQKNIRRMGTGEYTDSMIWEFWTDLAQMLVNKFAAQSYTALELKTKTTAIDKLEHLEHNKKTIMSWSVNTETVIRENERKTASLTARLEAAARCQSWGYPIGFHFDPMVIYPGYQADYKHVVKQIFKYISPANLVWISMGTFRFMPPLKNIIQKRFPGSKIIYGEFISGLDDKMRYFKPLRIDLYKAVYSCIKETAPDVPVYFCMEDDEVWKKSFGFIPSEYKSLPEILDISAINHCQLEFN
ncbi:Uncharacterized protein dnl_27380 [Desulfonema limicola]|uniref:DNA photolyase n=1 Tax=Desulfonema limicola TaxID=45656 RepID=A0A975B7N6_9BACT|nr:DNA photolyase [Desulfonema limicola]QTA80434.1 Uncharacterized protein dnl_27380 [Desulfonema limicola]